MGRFLPPSEHLLQGPLSLHWPEGLWMARPDTQVRRSRPERGVAGRWVVGEGQGQADPLPTSPGKMQRGPLPLGPQFTLSSRARARRGGGEQDAWDTVFKVELTLRGA